VICATPVHYGRNGRGLDYASKSSNSWRGKRVKLILPGTKMDYWKMYTYPGVVRKLLESREVVGFMRQFCQSLAAQLVESIRNW
jgi:hypothetical protein